MWIYINSNNLSRLLLKLAVLRLSYWCNNNVMVITLQYVDSFSSLVPRLLYMQQWQLLQCPVEQRYQQLNNICQELKIVMLRSYA